MSNVINKLKGILDMPLNEFFNVPIPTINCHVCELPEKIYYWFRNKIENYKMNRKIKKKLGRVKSKDPFVYK